jgi:hypothetical protein
VKDRLECFDELFPCLREGWDHAHASNWVSVLRFFYNNVRENEDSGRATLQHEDPPEYQRFIRLSLESLS